MPVHKASRLIAIAAVGLASQPALATSTWSFACGGSGAVCGGTVSPSLQYSGTNTTNKASVSGWANTGTQTDYTIPNTTTRENRFASGTVLSWSGGLGVRNSTETSGSPNHAIDNAGPEEFVLISFAEAVKLTSVGVGWYSGDFDMTILAYTGSGTPNLANNTLSPGDGPAGNSVGLTQAGWSLVGNYLFSSTTSTSDDAKQVGSNWQYDINTAGLTSSYWLVGAYNARVSGGSTGFEGNDYFKLLYAGGHTVTGGGGGNPVPVPGTLALVALGLPFLRRRLAA